MINKLVFAAFGVLLTATAAAADFLEPRVLNQHVLNEYSTWDLTLSDSGKPWFAYYGADNFLYVRRPNGDEVKLGATDRPIQQSGLAMAPSGAEGLGILWRDKLPSKSLFLIPRMEPTGESPAPIVVGSEADSEPLTRLKLVHEKDTDYLLWTGEKKQELAEAPSEDTQHALYFRTAEQGGKTLSPVERVMPGIYPAWIVEQKVIPVFSWMMHEGQLAMTMRVFNRAEKSFGPLVKIADAPTIGPIFEAFKSGDRWFLMWLGQYPKEDGSNADFLLEGVYSDDQGQNWKRFAFEELRGLDIGTVHAVTDNKKNIVVATYGNWRSKKEDPRNAKNNLYILRSTDNGGTWQKPQTVRPDEVRLTNAQHPVLALGQEPGTVMLAWEDWRDIRPNVYVSYSRDYGATWEPALPLGRPGVWNLRLDPYPQVMLSQKDRFSLVAKQYGDDSLNKRFDYVLYTFTWDQLQKSVASFKLPELRSAAANEARLRERVTSYWQAMQDNQYETAYALMDPFFRQARDLKTYLSQTGAIKYHRYQVGAISQQGNIAKVQMEIEASVPKFVAPSGGTVSQPAKTMRVIDTWVFVNNEWYREYFDQLSERPLTRY